MYACKWSVKLLKCAMASLKASTELHQIASDAHQHILTFYVYCICNKHTHNICVKCSWHFFNSRSPLHSTLDSLTSSLLTDIFSGELSTISPLFVLTHHANSIFKQWISESHHKTIHIFFRFTSSCSLFLYCTELSIWHWVDTMCVSGSEQCTKIVNSN